MNHFIFDAVAHTRAKFEKAFEKAEEVTRQEAQARIDHSERAAAMIKDQINEEVDKMVEKAENHEPLPPSGTPLACRFALLKHQQEGLSTMLSWIQDPKCKGGILADEDGLGKRYQVLALLAALPPTTKRPAIIVVPSSLMSVWQEEFKNNIVPMSELQVLFIHPEVDGAIPKASVTMDLLEQHNVFVTTHKEFLQDVSEKNRHTYTYRMFHGVMKAQ